MSWPEYVILGILSASLLVGLLRGFVQEFFALAVWAAALLIAYNYAAPVAGLLDDSISIPSVATGLAFVGLFISVLLVGGLVTWLVGRLVKTTGLSGTDRLLGAVFGGVRGVVLVVLLLLSAGLTPLPRDDWWRDADLLQRFLPLTEWAATMLPESISQHINLHPEGPATPASGQ